MLDIVAIAICAVICGADSWVCVEMFGRSKEVATLFLLPSEVVAIDGKPVLSSAEGTVRGTHERGLRRRHFSRCGWRSDGESWSGLRLPLASNENKRDKGEDGKDNQALCVKSKLRLSVDQCWNSSVHHSITKHLNYSEASQPVESNSVRSVPASAAEGSVKEFSLQLHSTPRPAPTLVQGRGKSPGACRTSTAGGTTAAEEAPFLNSPQWDDCILPAG